MPQVEYIGRKDQKLDNVAGTKAVWNGPGTVQEVSLEAWAQLAKYPDVWRLVPGGGDLSDVDSKPTKHAPPKADLDEIKREPKYALVLNGEMGSVVLDDMDADELRAFAKTHKVKIDGRVRDIDHLRSMIFATMTTAV